MNNKLSPEFVKIMNSISKKAEEIFPTKKKPSRNFYNELCQWFDMATGIVLGLFVGIGAIHLVKFFIN